VNIIRRENTESQETKIAVLCPIQFCVLCTILLIANDTFSLIAVGAAETFSIKSGGGGLPPDRALARCRVPAQEGRPCTAGTLLCSPRLGS